MSKNKKFFFGTNFFKGNSAKTDLTKAFASDDYAGVLELAKQDLTGKHTYGQETVKTKSEMLQNIKIKQNYFLVDPDPQTNYTRILGHGNEAIDLIFSTKFSGEHNSISGIVMGKPEKLSSDYKFKVDHINVGDRLYFHFNAIEIAKNNNWKIYDETGYEYLMIDAALCFCAAEIEHGVENTSRSKIKMLGDYVLVLPEMQRPDELVTKSGIILQEHPQRVPMMGIMAVPGRDIRFGESQVQTGEYVYFLKDSDIEIKIEDRTYYRMKNYDVLAKIEDDGTVIPIYDSVLVKPDAPTSRTSSGILLPDFIKSHQNTGKVIRSGPNSYTEQKSKIVYNKHAYGVQVKIDGETHLLIKDSDILCQTK